MTKWQESKFCRQSLKKLLAEGIREKVYNYFKKLGFTYVTLDLGGYRTGSMKRNTSLDENGAALQLRFQ